MSTYKSGSVNVIIGDSSVKGNNTEFNTNASSNYLFKLNNDNVYYKINTITNATNLTLKADYNNGNYTTGDSLNGMSYNIVTNYTTNYDLPEMSHIDTDVAYTYTKAMRDIDYKLFNFNTNTLVTASDIEVSATQRGVILHSPDNIAWRITVDNSGNLQTEKTTIATVTISLDSILIHSSTLQISLNSIIKYEGYTSTLSLDAILSDGFEATTF